MASEIPFSVRAGVEFYTVRMPLSPKLNAGQVRFILTWGAHPADLDSSLVTPSGCTIKYNKKICVKGAAKARLDVDSVNGNGPEVITIDKLEPAGQYEYFVNQFSSDGTLMTSNAKVEVYTSSGLVKTFDAARDGVIQGRKWRVAKINAATGAISEFRAN